VASATVAIAVAAAVLVWALHEPSRPVTAPHAAHLLAGERGHPVLLSFLDTQAEASTPPDPSRSQIVFDKSMAAQHLSYGLRVVIVDGTHASRDALINYRFDWSLPRSIAVVGDPAASIGRAYGVNTLPTTFLIDRHGNIVRRWDGFALAAQLDEAIRGLEGRSL
jgi:hypothetical protein